MKISNLYLNNFIFGYLVVISNQPQNMYEIVEDKIKLCKIYVSY